MKTVMTSSGDTWDAIAWSVWGEGADQTYTAALIAANPAHIERVIFPSGLRLVIPDIDAAPLGTLPPWRRNNA